MNRRFIEDFGPAVYELKENYRSSKRVLDVADKIIPGSCGFDNIFLEGDFEIYDAENEEDEARWIYNKIDYLIKKKTFYEIDGIVAYERIAILARTKYVFREIEELLKENNTPYYYKKAPGPIAFETKEMSVFNFALMVYLNPEDEIHLVKLCKIVNQKFHPKTKGIDALKEIAANAKLNSYKAIINILLEFNEDGSNLISLLTRLKKDVEKGLLVDKDDDKLMFINDIEEVLIHWYNYAKKTDRKSLHNFRNAMALGHTHPMAQNNGITLSTVHTMKGLEFDIVFIAGMNEGTFPDYRAIRDGVNGIEMKQEKNNAYVAVTRAKRFLYITWPKSKMMPWGDPKLQQKSRFIASL